jgi:hypothetical protein
MGLSTGCHSLTTPPRGYYRGWRLCPSCCPSLRPRSLGALGRAAELANRAWGPATLRCTRSAFPFAPDPLPLGPAAMSAWRPRCHVLRWARCWPARRLRHVRTLVAGPVTVCVVTGLVIHRLAGATTAVGIFSRPCDGSPPVGD